MIFFLFDGNDSQDNMSFINSDNDFLQKIEWRISLQPVDFLYSITEMEDRTSRIGEGKSEQMIWLLEHPSIYTAGISTPKSDLIFSNRNNIPIIQTNRGGKLTYHGPGILIVYPLLDLKKLSDAIGFERGVHEFVEFLQNWAIKILLEFGIRGFLKKDHVGIWVEYEGSERKIISVGIKIRKWVSYHGFAINVDPDLSMFDNITPCGIRDFQITSVAKILGCPVPIEDVARATRRTFDNLF